MVGGGGQILYYGNEKNDFINKYIFLPIYLPIRFLEISLASNFLLIPSPPQTCPASHAVVIQGVVDP